jgi:hypothetical protein
MASNPDMSPAHPIPVAAEPHVTRLRRHAHDFHLRGRRSRAYGASDVNHRFGYRDGAADDAAAEQGRRGESCEN